MLRFVLLSLQESLLRPLVPYPLDELVVFLGRRNVRICLRGETQNPLVHVVPSMHVSTTAEQVTVILALTPVALLRDATVTR